MPARKARGSSEPGALPRPRGAGACGFLGCPRPFPRALRPDRFPCRGGPRGRAALASRRACLLRERRFRASGPTLPLQPLGRGTRPLPRDRPATTPPARSCILRGLSSSLTRGAGTRWRKLHPGATRLRQPDGNRLLRGLRPVLPLSDVLDLLVHELAGLGARRLPLARILLRALDDILLWHDRPPRCRSCISRASESASSAVFGGSATERTAAGTSRRVLRRPEVSSIPVAQHARPPLGALLLGPLCSVDRFGAPASPSSSVASSVRASAASAWPMQGWTCVNRGRFGAAVEAMGREGDIDIVVRK